MSIVRKKPTSPGVRFVVEVSRPMLHKGQPYAALIEKKNSTGGRNNTGRITTRHQGLRCRLLKVCSSDTIAY